MKRLFLAGCILAATLSFAFAQTSKPTRPQAYPNFVKVNGTFHLHQKQQIWQEFLKVTPSDEMRNVSVKTDPLGMTHEKFQQYYKGIKVEGATYTLHARDGRIMNMSGNYRNVEDLNVQPSLSESAALQTALSQVNARQYIWEVPPTQGHDHHMHGVSTSPHGELVVIADPKGESAARLAYKFDIYAIEPLYRAWVYIDAHDATLIFENHRIHHANVSASGTSLYNGTVNFTADSYNGSYRLRQTADGGGIQTFDLNNSTNYNNASDITSSSTSFTATNVRTGVQAHYGAEQTHKYFSQKHGRNSFDGNGAIIRSYVSYSSNYVNAFWNGSVMTYGDGDGVNYGPLVSLDIVGHEITHGVTDFSADLIYSYESGALNESFSDIFGEAIENYATGSNDWQMGTDMGIGGSGAIRSMNNPNAYNDPDTYGGAYWYTGSGDNGGVHINSGVQNKWFYILVEGESGTNDLGNAYSVSSIGMDAAAAIAYRNLAVYLNASSNYAAARSGAIQAAIDLYGAGSAEEIAVTDAWYAVGVGDAYGPPQPPTCYGGTVDLTIVLDNYPGETTWSLTNSGGSTVAFGGPYSTAGSTVSQTFNLSDGDYTFTILDSYGDGICCGYGNGSYSLVSGSETIVSGGAFGSSASTSFCVDNGGGGPVLGCTDPNAHNYDPAATQDDGSCETCSDGTQNGDETGVDCGGALCAPCGGGGTTVLSADFFESGWDGWADGGSDCYRYNGSRSYEGNRSIRIRDNSGTASSMTKSFNMAGYSSVEVEFYFYSYSMENGEDFWVRYNDGSGWQTVASYARGTSFENNSFYTATVTISSAQYNLVNGGQLRFQCDASGNADHIYIDAVTVTGISGSGFMAEESGQTIDMVSKIGPQATTPSMADFDGELNLYPNPVHNELNLQVNDQIRSIDIYHINGQLVKTIAVKDELGPIDVSALPNGMYLIAVQTTEEVLHTRFLKN